MRNRQRQTVVSRLEEDTLKAIARAGRGRYFRAGGNPSSADSIASELSDLQKTSVESAFETRRIERFQLFLAAALIALVAAELIPDRIRPKRRLTKPTQEGETA